MDKKHGQGGVPSPVQLPSFAKMPSLLLLDATAKEENVMMKVSFVVDSSVTLFLLDGGGQMLTSHYSRDAGTAASVACKEDPGRPGMGAPTRLPVGQLWWWKISSHGCAPHVFGTC